MSNQGDNCVAITSNHTTYYGGTPVPPHVVSSILGQLNTVNTKPLKYSIPSVSVQGNGVYYMDNGGYLVSIDALSDAELVQKLLVLERWGFSEKEHAVAKHSPLDVMAHLYRKSVESSNGTFYHGYALLLKECQNRRLVPPKFADLD